MCESSPVFHWFSHDKNNTYSIILGGWFVSLFEGNLYTSGEIGKADLAKAAKYFTKAAEKG